jgi:hypothetical protein
MHISLLLYCHHKPLNCAVHVVVVDVVYASNVDGAAGAKKSKVMVWQ